MRRGIFVLWRVFMLLLPTIALGSVQTLEEVEKRSDGVEIKAYVCNTAPAYPVYEDSSPYHFSSEDFSRLLPDLNKKHSALKTLVQGIEQTGQTCFEPSFTIPFQEYLRQIIFPFHSFW